MSFDGFKSQNVFFNNFKTKKNISASHFTHSFEENQFVLNKFGTQKSSTCLKLK